ncbi:hypothetical protein L596_021166 [Steinernema carpocapsae]|uniref:Integrase catalytic domain-containing protein n=1 Tax=Steinernema carpocapsae TaxID=34508 RepID=A0A4U5MVR2_STECR|nr:hypothetical protein L596_021166 [Steinernema carpocapsae]
MKASMKSILRHHQTFFRVGEEKSRRKQLKMHFDKDGLWRCSRRLAESELDSGTCEPIFVQPHSELARAIVTECHETRQRFRKHLAVEHVVAEVRRMYWIPSLRSLAQSVKHRCVACRRFAALPFKYPTAHAIPGRRVRRSTPFQHVGLDYFGPLDFKTKDGSREKGYGMIVTCATTRLIHLEIVSNLTTGSFLLALKRFIGRRGVPESITSDNATTFRLGERSLNQMVLKTAEDGETIQFLADNMITWHFITPLSPWKGAFYERLIQSIKQSMNKAIGRRILFWEQLETLLIEIEGVLNSRPLTYQGSDVEDSITVRPIDFLQRGILLDLNLDMELEDDEYLPSMEKHSLRNRHQAVTAVRSTWAIVEAFWKVWQTRYLVNLKDIFVMKQGKTTNRSPQAGELVFLIEEDLPRNSWLMGKIEAVLQGKDGQVRTVAVRLPSGNVVNRPVNKIAPLEISADSPAQSTERTSNTDVKPQSKVARGEVSAQEPGSHAAAGSIAQRDKRAGPDSSEHETSAELDSERPRSSWRRRR